jgi:hypothetical protein
VKTDNSLFADKVELRSRHLPNKDSVSVLDCFHGGGRVWRAVKKKTGKSIRVLGIDKFDKDTDFVITSDAESVLNSIDLSKFDVVDLDSYGVPADELEAIFRKNYKGVVFVTFIQSLFGQLSKKILCESGFSEEMLEKAPVLCSKNGWKTFLNWLAFKKVKAVCHRSFLRKHYLCFVME